MATPANALVIMAKAPQAGKTKTRLVPPFSAEEAAEIARCLLLDQIEHLRSFAGANLFVNFTPKESASWFKEFLPSHFASFPQRGQDLGERMEHAFIELWSRNYANIAVIGSDLPTLPLNYLDQAFACLQQDKRKVVIGPSRDGGYYLIALSRPVPEIFRGISWGSRDVLSETVEKLKGLGIASELLPLWFDVDTFDDVRYWESVSREWPENSKRNITRFLRSRRSADRSP